MCVGCVRGGQCVCDTDVCVRDAQSDHETDADSLKHTHSFRVSSATGEEASSAACAIARVRE
eukprot:23457-Eustigmatos_ZCMA.PRE.1